MIQSTHTSVALLRDHLQRLSQRDLGELFGNLSDEEEATLRLLRTWQLCRDHDLSAFLTRYAAELDMICRDLTLAGLPNLARLLQFSRELLEDPEGELSLKKRLESLSEGERLVLDGLSAAVDLELPRLQLALARQVRSQKMTATASPSSRCNVRVVQRHLILFGDAN